MPNESTVQVVLPADVAAGIRELAQAEGLSASAYVRRLIVGRMPAHMMAWWLPPLPRAQSLPHTAQQQLTSVDPQFRLEQLTSSGAMLEVALAERGGAPITDKKFRELFLYQMLNVGRFLIRGSAHAWRVVHSRANARADDHVILLLEPKESILPH